MAKPKTIEIDWNKSAKDILKPYKNTEALTSFVLGLQILHAVNRGNFIAVIHSDEREGEISLTVMDNRKPSVDNKIRQHGDYHYMVTHNCEGPSTAGTVLLGKYAQKNPSPDIDNQHGHLSRSFNSEGRLETFTNMVKFMMETGMVARPSPQNPPRGEQQKLH